MGPWLPCIPSIQLSKLPAAFQGCISRLALDIRPGIFEQVDRNGVQQIRPVVRNEIACSA